MRQSDEELVAHFRDQVGFLRSSGEAFDAGETSEAKRLATTIRATRRRTRLRAGAGGFLLKDVPARELAGAIRVVVAGQSLLAPRVTRGIIERFVAQHPARKSSSGAPSSSATESSRSSASWARA